MSDEQFAEFCARYPDFFIEMTADGEILIMPPNHPLTGMRNTKIDAQLETWASRDGRGGTTGPSGGFVLPDGSRRAPDAAWILKSRIYQIAPAQIEGAWHLCPDFVIELRSPSDRLPALRAKMREWIGGGAQLGWLIDPERHAVEIYRPGLAPEIRTGIDHISGETPVEGFELDLRPVWDPIAL